MVLRKINAGVSLLATVMILDHAIFNGVWMLSRGSIVKTANLMSWVLFGVMLLHAIISIDLAISAHSNPDARKGRSYPKLNIPTIVQRASGVLLILFAVLHVAGTAGFLQPPPLVHAILPPLFFALSLVHVAVSFSKAFITLGIGNAAFVKVADVVMKVICAAALILDVVGFYLHLV